MTIFAPVLTFHKVSNPDALELQERVTKMMAAIGVHDEFSPYSFWFTLVFSNVADSKPRGRAVRDCPWESSRSVLQKPGYNLFIW
jgi:hypothetical protein